MSMWQAGSLFISSGRVLAANYEIIIANGTQIADTREFRYMQGPAQQQLIPKYEQVWMDGRCAGAGSGMCKMCGWALVEQKETPDG